jgi:uncharacterized membrane protein
MNGTARTWMWGAGVGAGTMWLLDRARGRRRRAFLRDKLAHLRHMTARGVSVTSSDVNHRLSGMVARIGATPHRGGDVEDDVIEARVRSALGRYVTHPHAIAVSSRDGRVTLQGPVLAHEVAGLIRAVRGIDGVDEVENHLEVHKVAGTVPGLQGGADRRRPRSAFMRDNWSPAARLAAGAGGASLLAWAVWRPEPRASAWIEAGIGAGLLARSLTNHDLRRLMGLTGRRAVDVEKTITIAAPIEEVFARWQQYEEFPRFMRHVRDVRDLGGGRSRWTVDGPGSVPIHWDAEVTRLVPDRLIAWKSLPGAAIQHAGVVRFDETPTGGTRVTIRLSYNPVAGIAGHGAALLFGADPKHQLDEDLVRMKTFVEEGVAPHDAAQPQPHPVPAAASAMGSR